MNRSPSELVARQQEALARLSDFATANESLASYTTYRLGGAAAVFAVGFFMRPIGGWLLGRYADKHGRRAALSASVLLMCGGSLLIAVTPGYATIGVAAPVLLVLARLLQGISVGGEYGARATYLSEMAGAEHRGAVGVDAINGLARRAIGGGSRQDGENLTLVVDDHAKTQCKARAAANLRAGLRMASLQDEIARDQEEIRRISAELAVSNRPVSYTPLTLPTSDLVENSGVAVSFKKKTKKSRSEVA